MYRDAEGFALLCLHFKCSNMCILHCRVYIAALIRPYVPVIFFGAFTLGAGGGGKLCNDGSYRQI